MRGLIRLILILLVLAAGYWAYYIFAAADPSDRLGVEINKFLPVSVREYGCQKLKERYGDITAPAGCADFAAWTPAKPSAPAPAAAPNPATTSP